jgi:hypothetical protein
MSKERVSHKKIPMESELFLRSINIALDADFPERVRHFRPTAKCVPLIRALLGLEEQRAFFLIAPYGSGKSITAAYAAHLVENSRSSGDVRLEINRRLDVVSPELAEYARKRRASSSQFGLAIVLHGHVPNLANQIAISAVESLKRIGVRRWQKLKNLNTPSLAETIKLIRSLCDESGCDRVTIVWDEFGRHLEALVSQGRADELSEIQILAEITARTTTIPITFCAILHQGLTHYASGIPQVIRSNWKKIEGRFETIQYVDDSNEVYRLVGEVIKSRRGLAKIPVTTFTALAKSCKQLGLFTEFKDRDLAQVLESSYPIEPISLYLLPRVAARVAQNERTLFDFLYYCDITTPITVCQLYDFFSPAMRSDTAVGGTYRQWLETESAISKVPNDTSAISALKTACLLGLGTSGERSRTSVNLLKFSLEGFQNPDCDRVLKELLDRKLLLHRVHNDDVSIWHGTDLDLRGRLEEERAKIGTEFDLVEFLNKEASPPVWKPVQYNDEHCIRRFLPGSYLTRHSYSLMASWSITQIKRDSDGHVVYLLADTSEDLDEAKKVAKTFDDDRVVFAIPNEPVPLRSAAIEVKALQRMQQDKDLIESDPIALAELHQMTDDAFEHLQKLIDRIVTPSSCGPKWYYRCKEFPATSAAELRLSLSNIMDVLFKKTPLINNEMINRKKPTPALVNARKKLTMAILERHGRERLGLDGFFPDRSMFNTVLLNTGLYTKDTTSERWSYVHEQAIKDPGLKYVWGQMRRFLTEPSDRPKSFSKLIDSLLSPPIGIRMGVIPILLAASLRAFPSAISLKNKGVYLNDILPSDIESICRSPQDYELLVLDIDDSKLRILRGVYKLLSKAAKYEIEENDLVRHCFDGLEAWRHQLPPAAFTTGRLSAQADAFRATIVRVNDPVQLFFSELPAALSTGVDKTKQFLDAFKACVEELENVADAYTNQAIRIVATSLSVGFNDDTSASVRDMAKKWASYFPEQFVENLTDGVAKGMLSRMSLDYESDSLLIDSLASLLVKKSVRRWDDSMAATFDREFTSYVTKIENAARSYPAPTDGLKDGLSRLVLGRVQQLFTQLSSLVGKEEAAKMVQQLSTRKEDSRHGITR